jgi:hypothetical protein
MEPEGQLWVTLPRLNCSGRVSSTVALTWFSVSLLRPMVKMTVSPGWAEVRLATLSTRNVPGVGIGVGVRDGVRLGVGPPGVGVGEGVVGMGVAVGVGEEVGVGVGPPGVAVGVGLPGEGIRAAAGAPGGKRKV